MWHISSAHIEGFYFILFIYSFKGFIYLKDSHFIKISLTPPFSETHLVKPHAALPEDQISPLSSFTAKLKHVTYSGTWVAAIPCPKC